MILRYLRFQAVDPIARRSDAFGHDPQFVPERFGGDAEVSARLCMRGDAVPLHCPEYPAEFVVHCLNRTSGEMAESSDDRGKLRKAPIS